MFFNILSVDQEICELFEFNLTFMDMLSNMYRKNVGRYAAFK